MDKYLRTKNFRITLMILSTTALVQSAWSKGQVTYSYLGRVNTPQQENIGDQFIQFEIEDKKQNESGLVYSAQFRHYPSANSQIYAVPEAYVHTRVGNHDWAVGRKIIPWQSNDEFWALGEVNPIRGFNLIETNREGLMGLHYRYSSKNWEVMVQGSPVNIPQVNPTFNSEDGKIEGKNEWSYPPPQYVRYRNNDVPVHYTLVYPDMKDIVLKNSASMSIDYKFEQGKIGIYGGYKPETSIRVNATGFYEQFDEERALVKAKPFMNNHYFWGGSFDYQFNSKKDADAWVSSVGIEGVIPEIGNDESFEFEAMKIQPNYERLTYSTASLTYRSTFATLSFNTLYLIDGDRVNTNVFAKKPKWRRAIGFAGKWSPWASIQINTLYRFDTKTDDMTFLSDISYLMTKHISLTAGVQLVNAPQDHSFWAPYRSNDTIYSRLSLIF